jgi:hypothetical protein
MYTFQKEDFYLVLFQRSLHHPIPPLIDAN